MSEDQLRAAARRVFIALDFPDADEALAMAEALAPLGVGLKMGLELFSAEGPSLARELAGRGELFLDLKYHDIPATVGRSVAAASRLGVSLMNLHVAGGEAMVRAAVEARNVAATADGSAAAGPASDGPAGEGSVGDGSPRAAAAPRLIGVTVLTSLDGGDLRAVWGDGLDDDASAHALRLAERARDWGLDGVVASAKESAAIRAACGPDFLIVTPGIRPAGSATGDQKRVLTPAAALAAGSSHLVIGRPVTRAKDPVAACQDILKELAASM